MKKGDIVEKEFSFMSRQEKVIKYNSLTSDLQQLHITQ